MVKTFIASLAAASALATAAPAALAAPAFAEHASARVQVNVIEAGHHRHYRRYHHHTINRREAIRIAASRGLARVTDIDRRGRIWEVEGYTRRGARIEVTIASNGRVIDVDYGRRSRRRWH
jgi:hypothetical protein